MTQVGLVLGTEDAYPLEFWVGVAEGQYLQLDDVVYVETEVPGLKKGVKIYGVVDLVRSRYEGARFDSDVFRASEGILPVGIATSAHVSVTRVDPEIYVPPRPGQAVHRASGEERDRALFFDTMTRRFPVGLARDGQPLWADLDYLDGTKGAHVNIAGISGVATKTSYAMFLLYSLFHHPNTAEAQGVKNASAIIFNVKGEDLLFLDRPNARLRDEHRHIYQAMGLPVGPFQDVRLWAPPAKSNPFELVPDTDARQDGVGVFCWSLKEFCQGRLLRFLFADADTESQLAYAVAAAERYLFEKTAGQPRGQAWVQVDGRRLTSFQDLVSLLDEEEKVFSRLAPATVAAFRRRLWACLDTVGHLIRGDGDLEAEKHRIDPTAHKLSVVHITKLHDQAKRFVVGVVLKQLLEAKDSQGTREPLLFVVLDELNKYAPREGWSPLKEVVLDIAERGRSLGVILIGAQQTASEVERRVVTNAAFRVTGRLDMAEAERSEYGFLGDFARRRAAILTSGSLFFSQPSIPLPVLVRFPFPAWATRHEEARSPDPWSRLR
jgi:DNA helicase HerA-like ATPase